MEFVDFPFDCQVCDFLVKELKLKETKDPKLKNFQWEPPNLIAEHVQRVWLVQIFLRVKTCSAQMPTSPEYDISLTMEGNLVKGNKAGRLVNILLRAIEQGMFYFHPGSGSRWCSRGKEHCTFASLQCTLQHVCELVFKL